MSGDAPGGAERASIAEATDQARSVDARGRPGRSAVRDEAVGRKRDNVTVGGTLLAVRVGTARRRAPSGSLDPMTSPDARPARPAHPARLVRPAVALLAALVPAAPAVADASDARIALSAGHVDGAWQRSMLESWGEVAERAAIDGDVTSAEPFTTREEDPSAQADQLLELIEDGPDAIVVNARFADALRIAAGEACAAGIVLVAFDGVLDLPCAWSIVADYRRMGRAQADYLAGRLPDGGNLLEVRDPEGTYAGPRIAAGVRAGTDVRGGLDVVVSVDGGRTRDDARRAVADALPGLPPIAGVVTSGGDGLGVARAFAEAGRDAPIVVMGNRHEELAWWHGRARESGYETTSAALVPGVSTLAFQVARLLLEGASVPKVVTIEPLRVDADGLEQALALTEPDGVTNALYSLEDARRVIEGARTTEAR